MLNDVQAGSLYAHFRQAAERTPDKLALVIGSADYTYHDLLKTVDALAGGLTDLGVHSGEHLGVLLPNCAEFVLVLLAGARLGVVIVPQSMGLSAEAVVSTFTASHVQHLIVWSGVASSIEGMGRLRDGVCVVVGGYQPDWVEFQTVLDKGHNYSRPLPNTLDDLPYLMVLTSGSTGQPKPILLSQRTKLRIFHARHLDRRGTCAWRHVFHRGVIAVEADPRCAD